MQPQDFIMMPIPAKSYTAVCALLGGAAFLAGGATAQLAPQEKVNVGRTDVAPNAAASIAEVSQAVAIDADDNAPAGDVELDAHGHPWSSDLHASTKAKTKDGLWRMKPGASRPDPLPGYPFDETSEATGTSSDANTNSATSPTVTEAESVPEVISEDDEFAAFREAAEASNAADEAAVADVPARKFSDADLGALCNQAAVKLGDPSPIKEIIAQFVPKGQVAHSRNIPEDRRNEFAMAVEEKAGIKFAG